MQSKVFSTMKKPVLEGGLFVSTGNDKASTGFRTLRSSAWTPHGLRVCARPRAIEKLPAGSMHPSAKDSMVPLSHEIGENFGLLERPVAGQCHRKFQRRAQSRGS